ncbi:MAG: hypothetical protein AB1442_00545 [Nitrospirota bacterium]
MLKNLSGLFLLLLPVFVGPAAAVDCEIVDSRFYEKQQEVIATEWIGGIPYMVRKTEIYPCADITFRNVFWQALYSSDIEVTATFADGSSRSKKVECGKKLLEPNDKFSCSVCFENEYPLSKVECRFK